MGISAIPSATRSAIIELSDAEDAAGFFEPYDVSNIKRGQFVGDRARPGPIFNYARAFIWTYRAECLLNRYRQYINTPTDPSPTQSRSVSFKHMIYSLFLALIMQWCTSIAAIVLVYETPTVGLSCWSGGFLIYAVSATIILLSLMFSSFLSDLCISAKKSGKSAKVNLFGYAAVILRVLGKTIAVLNAVWIFIHCVFQFTSFYDNCWCNANYAIMGQKGYWIWLSTAQLRELLDISETWGGTTALATVVPGLYIVSFLVTHHHYQL